MIRGGGGTAVNRLDPEPLHRHSPSLSESFLSSLLTMAESTPHKRHGQVKAEKKNCTAAHKRARHAHPEDTTADVGTDVDTVTDISDCESQSDDPVASRSRYATFRVTTDQAALSITCARCHLKYRTDTLKTLFKPVDLEYETTHELEGGHVALQCNVILKRRTYVCCPACQHEEKIANNLLDQQVGAVLGSVLDTTLKTPLQPSDDYVAHLKHQLTRRASRRSVKTLLPQLLALK